MLLSQTPRKCSSYLFVASDGSWESLILLGLKVHHSDLCPCLLMVLSLGLLSASVSLCTNLPLFIRTRVIGLGFTLASVTQS